MKKNKNKKPPGTSSVVNSTESSLLSGRTDGHGGVESGETVGDKTERVVGMAPGLKERLDLVIRPAFEHP